LALRFLLPSRVQGRLRRSAAAKVASAALMACVLLISATPALAMIVVTNTNDNGAGSLRQAITDANAGGGTITFAAVSPDRR
jgi:hypothetical protein